MEWNLHGYTCNGVWWDLNTAGYCEIGDKVSFKLYRPSTGDLFNLKSDDSITWEDNSIEIITSMNVSYGDFVSGYKLNDIYPNPFNPSTTINFSVAENVYLSLVIYDMQGRAVETLVSQNFAPGVYELNWNATNLASGIYFAKLSSSGYEQTQKLMLIK